MLIFFASSMKAAPISFHWPPPSVGIVLLRNHIPKIVMNDAGKRLADRFNQLRESLGTIVTQLQFTADPMDVWNVPFRCLVINADPYRARRMTDKDALTLRAPHRFGIVAFADKLQLSRMLRDLLHRQDPGMIVIGDVKPRHLAAVFLDPLKKTDPALAARLESGAQRFQCTAALAGQLAPHAHIFAAVVVDVYAAEILLASVAPRTLAFNERHTFQAQRVNDLIRAVLLAGEAQPVE